MADFVLGEIENAVVFHEKPLSHRLNVEGGFHRRADVAALVLDLPVDVGQLLNRRPPRRAALNDHAPQDGGRAAELRMDEVERGRALVGDCDEHVLAQRALDFVGDCDRLRAPNAPRRVERGVEDADAAQLRDPLRRARQGNGIRRARERDVPGPRLEVHDLREQPPQKRSAAGFIGVENPRDDALDLAGVVSV